MINNFEDAFDLLKSEIDTQLSSSPFIVRRYMEHLKESQGKLIRAVSLLICAQNDEGSIPKDAVKLAAAIELLHLATLVHDDVIDNSDIRRGKETLQKKYGRKTAVICGDYILCKALKLASTISSKEDYLDINVSDYMSKVCLGELNQHINNGNLDLSLYQYFKIISGKTAALFEASFYCGALIGKMKESDLIKYQQLGNYIGMIFQISDDCIDFEDTVESAKKPVQSDYEQGVITLPLIYTLENLKGFKDKAKKSGLSRREINEAVKKAGGVKFALSVSGKYYAKAIKVLDSLDLSEDKKSRLFSILNKSTRK